MRYGSLAALLVLPALAFASHDGETPEARLAAAGYTLPARPKPVATYVTSMRTGNLLFLSGHGECGETLKTGKGRGARSAVGMQSLPSDIPVEIEATVELYDGP